MLWVSLHVLFLIPRLFLILPPRGGLSPGSVTYFLILTHHSSAVRSQSLPHWFPRPGISVMVPPFPTWPQLCSSEEHRYRPNSQQPARRDGTGHTKVQHPSILFKNGMGRVPLHFFIATLIWLQDSPLYRQFLFLQLSPTLRVSIFNCPHLIFTEHLKTYIALTPIPFSSSNKHHIPNHYT